MQRLTHKRESGMKSGYWSPNKKQELVDRLAMYEDAAEEDRFGKWIPCSERLPEDESYIMYMVKCNNPDCPVPVTSYPTGHNLDEVIAEWNRRADNEQTN